MAAVAAFPQGTTKGVCKAGGGTLEPPTAGGQKWCDQTVVLNVCVQVGCGVTPGGDSRGRGGQDVKGRAHDDDELDARGRCTLTRLGGGGFDR